MPEIVNQHKKKLGMNARIALSERQGVDPGGQGR